MDHNPNSSFRPYLASTIILLLLGWGCAAFAVLKLTPNVWARWLLFFGGTLGLIGLALPVSWFLNLRFPSVPLAGSNVIVREAIWVGVYGALITWLQQERLVTLWTSIGLAVGLVAVEYLIRMRENARWQPAPNLPPSESKKPSENEDQMDE
jgi:hypothetical protein